jgi:phenol 2-monooxygenase
VYATDPQADIFELRGVDRGGVVVVVRPDQYVANVLPLTATAELGAFFAPLLAPRLEASAASGAVR